MPENNHCFICGGDGAFHVPEGWSLRESLCSRCGAARRNRDLAKTILELFVGLEATSLADSLDRLKDLSIFEAQAEGPIHLFLKELPGYVCSEYLEDAPLGAIDGRGIRSEDLERLSFADRSFDLAITQDVLEHVRRPYKAFSEIRRVLKPGGYHVFTVPLHEGRQTTRRTVPLGGRDIDILPTVFHGDPLRREGSLVYTDFGDDIIALTESLGFATSIAGVERFYPACSLPWIADDEAHRIYEEFKKRGDLLKILKYNSIVFASRREEAPRKPGLPWTGERFLPWLDESMIHYEHLHRYAFARTFAAGKDVLDVACGEGYGSAMLAETASSVLGLDIDGEAVIHASASYIQDNLAFIEGAMTAAPIREERLFDVIVCFEALEHIDDHEAFMKEAARLLKPEGVLIVSTPNKKVYSDGPSYSNPYHLRELYLEEFKELLSRYFSQAHFFGQAIETASRIWPLVPSDLPERRESLLRVDGAFRLAGEREQRDKYYIAVASNAPEFSAECLAPSILLDLSERIIGRMDRTINSLSEELAEKNRLLKAQAEECGGLKERIAQIEGLMKSIESRRPRSFREFLKEMIGWQP
ncbi:MAG: methyltransferase domain-containing protein [Deltaproteobacteria bacterium]|nr:methyltransferase domain-containing protein [Deltaproteobacteria bacterium]